MGVIFGIVNIIVAVWFYASAVSVKKQAVLWALIGGLSFIAFKTMGYSVLAMIQGALDQTSLDVLSEQGYIQSDKSAEMLSNETFDDQNTAVGIFYEFFPLIMALLGVSFMRAKLILGMGYIASLKHKTPLKFATKGSTDINTKDQKDIMKRVGELSSWWNKRKRS